MTVTINTNILHFPPEEEIIDYLNTHPITNPSSDFHLILNFTDKKVIEVVAKFFANREIFTEYQVNQHLARLDLGFPRFARTVVLMDLGKALIDCVNKKEIPKRT
ncbi:MAG: hypothetical protein Q8L98_04145 [Chlamydiales bacterium]|nr:hypothetical protein [Chlamydiales bacterium]